MDSSPLDRPNPDYDPEAEGIMEDANRKLLATKHQDQAASELLAHYLTHRQHRTLRDVFEWYQSKALWLYTNGQDRLEIAADFTGATTAQDVRDIARKATRRAYHRSTLPDRCLLVRQPDGLEAFADKERLSFRIGLSYRYSEFSLVVDPTPNGLFHFCLSQRYREGQPIGDVNGCFEELAWRIWSEFADRIDGRELHCRWYLHIRAPETRRGERSESERFWCIDMQLSGKRRSGTNPSAKVTGRQEFETLPAVIRELASADVFDDEFPTSARLASNLQKEAAGR